MDRNNLRVLDGSKSSIVALRKESVDRNFCVRLQLLLMKVALRKESVDRNTSWTSIGRPNRLSLSARRAWIEMIFLVAPGYKSFRSLSARRAWIEIFVYRLNCHLTDVALRKESVDRNCDLEPIKNPEAVALRKESVDRNLCFDFEL